MPRYYNSAEFDAKLIDAAERHLTARAACRELGIKYDTYKRHAERLGVFKSNPSGRGMPGEYRPKIPLEAVFTNEHCLGSSNFRKRLIKEGYKKAECEECGLTEWRGKQLPLELHHIDLNHYNNDLKNLQILCPNCHSLYPNHLGKRVET